MEQAATFKAFPHIGEKVFGYLTEEQDFKSGFSVCKSWNEILNEILKNPLFWLKKLKELNQSDEEKQKLINSTLELIHLNIANKELSMSFQEKMFSLKKLKNPALEWKGFSDANIELAKSLRRKYFEEYESTKHKCNTCKRGFPTFAILNCHQEIHLVEQKLQSDICFYCADCKIGFPIYVLLAMHLRSKSHIMKLENSGKLPVGLYDRMEQMRNNFNAIDSSSCETALESLKSFAATM